jgi:hypothetical protein
MGFETHRYKYQLLNKIINCFLLNQINTSANKFSQIGTG